MIIIIIILMLRPWTRLKDMAGLDGPLAGLEEPPRDVPDKKFEHQFSKPLTTTQISLFVKDYIYKYCFSSNLAPYMYVCV